MSDTSQKSGSSDAGNTTGTGDTSSPAGARSPGDPSILVSVAETTEDEADALSELDEISAALVEPGAAAPAPTAPGASVSGPKPGGSSQQKAAPAGVQALVGTVISARYKVEEVLAAGGMGCVYRGEHVHMHKRVAIKVLLPNTEQLPDLVQRFKREAVAGAHIDHPNIAAATDFGMLDDGSFFLILQFVRGVTLHDIIRRGPLPAPRAARIGRQIASALDACHRLGIVHRDLKPRNIMVEEDRDDFVKLIDFGFAKVPLDRIATIEKKASLKDVKVTGMGTIFGTPTYMAPEIVLGMDAVNERSDLYALGLMIYEMLAGAHPFNTKNPSDVLRMHRTVIPPPIAERTGVDVPPALEAVAMRLLKKDPTLRYPSAAAVVEAIDEAAPGALPPRAPQSTYPQLSPESAQAQASSQPPSAQASSPSGSPSGPRAPSQPSDPAAAPAQAVAAAPTSAPVTPKPATAPKPSDARPRGGVATPPASRTAVPRWALPASFLSLLVAIGVLVYALRGENPTAPAAHSDVTASPPAPTAPPVATATATATAPPSAAVTQSPKPSEPRTDTNLAPLRTRLRTAADSKDWARGAEALLELADRAPQVFEDRIISRAAVAIATGMAADGDDRADTDKVFDALATKLGSAGLDMLYDIVSTRGSSKAAIRATELLRDKQVLERASPALRVAIELRDAPSCQERLALLDRAKKDGDTRAVAVLEILRSQKCIAGAGECCFRSNGAVDETMKEIYARVRSSPTQ